MDGLNGNLYASIEGKAGGSYLPRNRLVQHVKQEVFLKLRWSQTIPGAKPMLRDSGNWDDLLFSPLSTK